jgi:ribonucleoside-diphosphate reductase alpha chain
VKLRLPQYLSSNELTPLGRKTFLDRYAKKAPKTDPLSPGDLVVICTNPDPDNRQQEVGEVVAHNSDGRTVTVRTEGGEDHVVDVEAVDKPLEKTPEELMDRVSAALAEIEEDSDKWTARFRQLLDNWGFVPAGRILTGAGIQRKTPLTFFNCNVIPAPKDSRAGIMKTGSQLSELFSRGAGVGTHLSSLRPRYSYVKGVNGRSSGSVSWGSLFSHITGLIEQGGCVHGDTLVETTKGPVPIRDLVGTTPEVMTYDRNMLRGRSTRAAWVAQTGTDRRLKRIQTNTGFTLVATPDHPLMHVDGEYRSVEQTQVGDKLMPLPQKDSPEVTAVEDVPRADVYDMEIPDTHNFAVVSDGSGSFIHNSRRGALMLVLHVWHPDVLEFIECKREPKAKKLAELADKLEFGLGLKDMADEARQLAADWPKAISHANLSVGITDDFMDAVIHDRDWKLIFPDTSHPDYEEHWDGDIQEWQDAGRPVKVHKVLKARELWEKLMHSAWDSAEPGVIYIDTINSTSTSWWYCKLLATNPCGEQPLPSWYGCCNLGALNLPRFLKEDPENPNRIIMDWDAYEEAITDAIRFLDNVIGTTPYFFQEQEENAKFERRVGLSPFMGLAEALALLGLRYGSDEAVEFINTEIGPFAARKALWASVKLAEEKGPAPVLETEGARRSFLESKYVRRAMDRMPSDEREDFVEAVMEYGLRNISLTTSAPTGSIGTLVATSTGIEPFFLFEYKHRTNLGLHIKRERVLEEWHRQHGEKATPPDFFVTAAKLTPTEHVRMQAALQRWIDSAISKTTNLPAEYTPEDVGNFYMDLWKRGCKGGTVYREGSRTVQVLSSVDGPEAPIKKYASLFPEKIELVGRNDRDGKTWTVDTPGGTLHATINHHPDTDQPFETFIRVGKGGSDLSAMSEAFGRLMSLDLQLQGPVQSRRRCEMIADQLEGIGGRDQVGFGPNKVRSIPDGVAKAMRMHLEWMDGRKAAAEAVRLWNEEEGATECEDHEARIDALRKGLDMCPDCGQITLRLEEGCTSCALCGYSKC